MGFVEGFRSVGEPSLRSIRLDSFKNLNNKFKTGSRTPTSVGTIKITKYK